MFNEVQMLKPQYLAKKITIQSNSRFLCINALRGAMTAFKLLSKPFIANVVRHKFQIFKLISFCALFS